MLVHSGGGSSELHNRPPLPSPPAGCSLTAGISRKPQPQSSVHHVCAGKGSECGDAIATHPQVDKVAFTGSTSIGKTIMAGGQGGQDGLAWQGQGRGGGGGEVLGNRAGVLRSAIVVHCLGLCIVAGRLD